MLITDFYANYMRGYVFFSVHVGQNAGGTVGSLPPSGTTTTDVMVQQVVDAQGVRDIGGVSGCRVSY